MEEATGWLQRATRAPRYENRCFPHYNLGRIYERKDNWPRAMDCYRSALAENSRYKLARTALRRLEARLN